MSRSATLFVCDDLHIENNGKLMFIGVYPGDLAIPTEVVYAGQSLFVFTLDTAIAEAPKHVEFEVTLPGEETTRVGIDVPQFEAKPEHTRWYMRQMVGTYNRPLRAGRIIANVICDGEPVTLGAPWIRLINDEKPIMDSSVSPPPA